MQPTLLGRRPYIVLSVRSGGSAGELCVGSNDFALSAKTCDLVLYMDKQGPPPVSIGLGQINPEKRRKQTVLNVSNQGFGRVSDFTSPRSKL